MKSARNLHFFLLRPLAAIAILANLGGYAPAVSQQARSVQPPERPRPEEQYRQSLNRNTITILGASLSGAYIKIVDDIAKAVNDGEKLRVLPMVGDGGSQNIRDLIYLRGVDVGIVMSTSMDAYKGKPLYGNLSRRLQYIARLYEEEFHIVGGTDIASVEDLHGSKVGFHGGAFVSGQELFKKLRVKPSEAVQVDFFKGLEQIKGGEIAAVVRATASPMQDLDTRFDPAAHKLVPISFTDDLIESYLPGELTHAAYPRIVAEGQSVPTAAIGVVLASYAWRPGSEPYNRVARFTDAFFSNMSKILAGKDRHPKWDDVNLAATLPGWQRFPAAEAWLKRKGYTVQATAGGEPAGSEAPASASPKLKAPNPTRSKSREPASRQQPSNTAQPVRR
jgi:TRAP-type uncharacterized transport system substrate-binding protein